ncbi:unnamed protein product [Didymodactylos carnosus]|uniref:Uncharacterized protein n=1 Tax=Didymodactylos carnosus TaxID=1234261 RepID=A0A8S2DYR5_9BILA|nr:unnamed protein product [Didymodactylos carnosus]CAF3781127.1 unnamed protein product [Didymodactylos carnosus]
MTPPTVSRTYLLNSFLSALTATNLETLDRLDEEVFTFIANQLNPKWPVQQSPLLDYVETNVSSSSNNESIMMDHDYSATQFTPISNRQPRRPIAIKSTVRKIISSMSFFSSPKSREHETRNMAVESHTQQSLQLIPLMNANYPHSDETELIHSHTPASITLTPTSVTTSGEHTFPTNDSVGLIETGSELCGNPSFSSTPTLQRRFSKSKLKMAPQVSNKNTVTDDTPTPLTSSSGLVIFESAFDELCDWLIGILNTGTIVSMMTIQQKYSQILNLRNNKITDSIVRPLYIRKRLENRFCDLLHFETPSDKKGTYVSLNSLSAYIRLSISKSKETPYSVLNRDMSNEGTRDRKDSETLFDTIRILRNHITIGHQTLKTFNSKTEKLASFIADDFWACAPMLLRNVFGLITIGLKDSTREDSKSSSSFDEGKSVAMALNLSDFAKPHKEFHSLALLGPVLPRFLIYHLSPILSMINVEESQLQHIFSPIAATITSHISTITTNDLPQLLATSTPPRPLTTLSVTPKLFIPFKNHIFDIPLFAYALLKYYCSSRNREMPLLTGFFATHLKATPRPPHIISFCPPINEDPSSRACAKICLEMTKCSILDNQIQKETVNIADEKIYSNCIKIKDNYNGKDPFSNLFVMPGDFHIMKNYMILIWLVLDGIGIDDLFGHIYHGATLRSILNVSRFNKSFRCVKLLYTSLYILLIEQFYISLTLSSDPPTMHALKQIQSILSQPPNPTVEGSKLSWFDYLVMTLNSLNVMELFKKWCADYSAKSITFRFWTFILFNLLEPIIKLYLSIRTVNFDSRNAAISLIVPMFFGQKRRNYAPLGARHIADLQRASSYLLNNLSTSFAVQRTSRPFSSIALDQTIECTINRYGKGRGGITGHFNMDLIDKWTQSFAFRALLSHVTSEICGYETATNNLDSHIECSPSRLAVDITDLQLILSKLKPQNLFLGASNQVRTLFTGKIIHSDIIDNICSSYKRGFDLMKSYIEDRLLISKVKIEEKIDFEKVLRLTDSDKYNN